MRAGELRSAGEAKMPLLLLLVVAVGFGWGVLRLFGIEFASGTVYPAYSSLRADPDGARLLYDSLARLPGMKISRSYVPLELLSDSDATVLVLGLDARKFGKDMDLLRAARRLAERGNRVVLAAEPLTGTAPIPADKLNREWGVRFGVDPKAKADHRLYFSKAEDWESNRSHDRAAFRQGHHPDHRGEPRLRQPVDDCDGPAGRGRRGAGAQPAHHFRRAALRSDRIGKHRRVSAAVPAGRNGVRPASLRGTVDLAEHFGVSTSRARGGRRAAGGAYVAGGLLTLLRRHIRPADLPAVCWREWVSSNRVAWRLGRRRF